jgi:hypothetical protein
MRETVDYASYLEKLLCLSRFAISPCHGKNAEEIEAARCADLMLKRGNLDGQSLTPIVELRAAPNCATEMIGVWCRW